MAKQEVFIVSSQRTPIGSFGGSLTPLTATELGAHAAEGCITASSIPKELIEELIFGNVCSANLGQAPARQVAIKVGLRAEVCCTTINKVCASGMKSLTVGAQAIRLGDRDIVMVGGMESMSNCPYYLTKTRWGNKYGHHEVIDGLQKDGLQDVYEQLAMGLFADRAATRYEISREEQDHYTIRSYKAAAETWTRLQFNGEVTPITIDLGKGKIIEILQDEEFSKVDFNKIPNLKPAFSKEGTVTAANASKISDGGAATIIMSEKKMKELGLKPLARVVAYADAEQEPQWFTTSPVQAANLALKKAGLTVSDIDLYEVNEAFAMVPLAFIKLLDIELEKVNIRGGAVSLGHPLGASGARIVTTLTHTLLHSDGRYGMAAICNGGGGATAVIIEKCS